MEFTEKIVLVTGGASGIGLATSKQLQKLGAFVILADIDAENLELAKINLNRDRMLALRVDLTKTSDVEELSEEIRVRFGKLDVLVNNAGFLAGGSVENVSLDTIDSLFKLMSRAMYHLTSTCVPLLKVAKGCVVNVSSLASTKADPSAIGYSMMKASVDAFTRCAAKDLASNGIRVNSVNPGLVNTALWEKSGMGDLMLRYSEKAPLGRVGCPEDVSEAICFLASSRASYITGIHVLVDGGINLI